MSGGGRSDAVISPCGRYRYQLSRHWDDGAWSLPIIMLNPSTADASIDDPTIRRCMAFARRDGFGGIRVANLFAFRATSPDDMRSAEDPFGPDGSTHIEQLLEHAAECDIPVLAAWGAHGGFRNRDKAVVYSAKGWGAKLVCLGTTKDGHPRHPLYVRGDQPFVPFPSAPPHQGAPLRADSSPSECTYANPAQAPASPEVSLVSADRARALATPSTPS